MTQAHTDDELNDDAGGIQAEIAQRRPFHSVKAEVAVSILRTAALIERHFAQVVAQSGITVQQYNVLRILRGAEPGGYPRCEIAHRMIERAPDLTRMIDRLSELGLVERGRSSEDRRHSVTRITRRGLELLDEARPAFEALHRAVTARLTRRECEQLSELLERLYGEA